MRHSSVSRCLGIAAGAALCLGIYSCTEPEPLYCQSTADCKNGFQCNTAINTCVALDVGTDAAPKDGPAPDTKPDTATDSAPPDKGQPDVGPTPCSKHKDCKTGQFCAGSKCVVWATRTSGVTVDLKCIWGSSAADIWAVGDKGTVLRHVSGKWVQESSGTTNNLRSVWGTSSTNVWAVGDKGTILHYDGSVWKVEPKPSTGLFEWIWGSSATDIYAVGETAGVYRYDGSSWKSLSTEIGYSGFTPHGVGGSSATDVWIGAQPNSSKSGPTPRHRPSLSGTASRFTTMALNGHRCSPQMSLASRACGAPATRTSGSSRPPWVTRTTTTASA
jgi:hypothetical protein